MIDDKCTKMRNEIMRNIKLHQMKEKNLPNFIRKKREEFLSRRAQSNDVTVVGEKSSHPHISVIGGGHSL